MRDDRHDVRRLFECLVASLAEGGSARAHQPFQIAEIYQTIVPYRTHRARLGVDSNEDYEMAVLRLVAGEGGYASVEPPEAAEALAAEAKAVNPDPGLVRDYAGATVRLTPARVRTVLEADAAYAPPEPEPSAPQPSPPEPEPTAPEPEPTEPAPPSTEVPAEPHEEPRPSKPVFALEAVEPAEAQPTLPVHRPPDPVPTGAPDPAPASDAPEARGRPSLAGAATCRGCGRALPLTRQVTYCPFCGRPPHAPTCRNCGAELETGWRFCIDCGFTVGAPPGRAP